MNFFISVNHPKNQTDKSELIDKILEYKLDMSPETKKWLEKQELIAKGISKGKPKNTKK